MGGSPASAIGCTDLFFSKRQTELGFGPNVECIHVGISIVGPSRFFESRYRLLVSHPESTIDVTRDMGEGVGLQLNEYWLSRGYSIITTLHDRCRFLNLSIREFLTHSDLR